MAEEHIEKLQQELKDSKLESRERIEMIENKLHAAETNKAELSAKEMSLKENVA